MRWSHLDGPEDGLGVDLVVAVASLVEEDLLAVGVSAQQLQLARRHFGNPDEPLHHGLLLLAALWNGSGFWVSSSRQLF